MRSPGTPVRSHSSRAGALLASIRCLAAALLGVGVAVPRTAGAAAEGPPHGTPSAGPGVVVRAELQSIAVFRSDADFDRTEPRYDANGQTVGAAATVFTPRLTFAPSPDLRITYEAEIGLNFWSRNDPDIQDPLTPGFPVMKHREIFGEADLWAGSGTGTLKVGYQRVLDTTGLFLNHWIGAATATVAWSATGRADLLVAQMPDSTYEGVRLTDNNFRHDAFLFGARADVSPAAGTSVAAAVHALYDAGTVGRTRWLVAPNFRLARGGGEGLSGFLGGMVQMGRREGWALHGTDQELLAWALQGHVGWLAGALAVDLNALALSPDDASDGNAHDGAFLYSGKCASATRLLTEDEVRDVFDNLDERLGPREGGFTRNRAGLALADVRLARAVGTFRPALEVGAAAALEPRNALDRRHVGTEVLADLEVLVSGDRLVGHLTAGVLLPGGAAAALVNRIDRSATDPVWTGMASLAWRYGP